jgi:hypothetical protein
MPFTEKSWDGSASRYRDTDEYCRACLIDVNPPGEDKTQAKCKLPIKEPDGTYNKNALRAAAAALLGARGGVEAPQDEKRKAARKLLRLMKEAGMEAGESLRRLAGEL